MSWSDPEVIAAMEALKDAPPADAPLDQVVDLVAQQMLADLERAAGGDIGKQTCTRVIRAIVPILSELKERQAAKDARSTFDMSLGLLKGIGFTLGGALSYVPSHYYADAIKLVFEKASLPGRFSFSDVQLEVRNHPPGEPKK